MKSEYLMVFIIVLFLFSCNKKSQKEVLYTDKIISAEKINSGDFLLSSITDSVSFVPLETADECLIKNVDKLYWINDSIFILDKQGNNKVLVFDGAGRFIRTIGAVGNGPGEYIQLNDFCVDTLSRCLYFLCSRFNIYQYSYEGKFIKKRNLQDFYADNIEYNKGRLFFAASGPPGGQRYPKDKGNGYGYNLIVTDTLGKILYEEFPNEIFGDNRRLLARPFYTLDSIILYRIYLDHHIYGVKKNNELFVHYYIDLGDNAYTINAYTMTKPPKSYPREVYEEILSRHRVISHIVENGTHLLFFFFNRSNPMWGIYDKKTETCNCYYKKNMIDDITGLSISFFEYVNKNTFIAVVHAFSIIDQKEKFKNKAWFENLNLSEASNPVLYVIKTKN
ncbi:MAG: 6-bladed beta-propeller [Prevotellaceae bacterium]|jgi:hypothetical protein|nr:6-bladed beta-propeller [Prevotellaceae bacterium]